MGSPGIAANAFYVWWSEWAPAFHKDGEEPTGLGGALTLPRLNLCACSRQS
jgi:hypothetical protein